jgi:site-specific DNA-methyltransferase (adenine-specific)
VDAIITDIPYGTTACGWDVVIPFAPMWEGVKRVLKPRGVFVTTASQPFTSMLVMSNLKWFKYEWIWIKERGTGFILSGRRPLMIIEDILVFYPDQPIYNPQRRKLKKAYRHILPIQKGKFEGSSTLSNSFENGIRKYTERTHDTPTQVLEFSRDDAGIGSLHPTQKPVSLYEYLIRTYTNPDDTVLDICMGSGTTGVACVKTQRNFIGCELKPEYFEIAQRRIAEAQLQEPLFTEAIA